jgi:hypothetical protein
LLYMQSWIFSCQVIFGWNHQKNALTKLKYPLSSPHNEHWSCGPSKVEKTQTHWRRNLWHQKRGMLTCVCVFCFDLYVQRKLQRRSSKWKFEFTGPNKVLLVLGRRTSIWIYKSWV